jgi:branched-chain amino acid transport system substrate-binding protein
MPWLSLVPSAVPPLSRTVQKTMWVLCSALALAVGGCKSPDSGTASTSGGSGSSTGGGASTSGGSGSAPSASAAPAYNADQPEILIGAYFSLTGATATFGKGSVSGISMAFDEINAKGGINGKKIKLITIDDASKTEQAASAVQQLINQHKVLAILGEVASSNSLAAAPICQKAQVPMLSPSSTNPKVTQVGDYIFRACFIDPFQGAVISKFARENLKAKKAAVLTDTASDYSKGLSEVFVEDWKKNGGQVVAEASYAAGDKDFRGQLTSIKGKAPEVIVVPGYYTEVGNIAVQARSSGLKQPMLGGDGWDSPKLFEVAKAQLQGSYFSNHYSSQSKDPKVVKFVADYKAKYGSVPDALTAVGYDAAYVMADAIKRAGALDRAKVRDALAQTKELVGVTGTISMDENRNAIKPAVMLQIAGNEAKYVTTVKP